MADRDWSCRLCRRPLLPSERDTAHRLERIGYAPYWSRHHAACLARAADRARRRIAEREGVA